MHQLLSDDFVRIIFRNGTKQARSLAVATVRQSVTNFSNRLCNPELLEKRSNRV